jgi:hypothetical protein
LFLYSISRSPSTLQIKSSILQILFVCKLISPGIIQGQPFQKAKCTFYMKDRDETKWNKKGITFSARGWQD